MSHLDHEGFDNKVSPEEIYFLQDLALFFFGGSKVVPPEQIEKSWRTVLGGRPKEEVIKGLQDEADRLHHGISVGEVLSSAIGGFSVAHA